MKTAIILNMPALRDLMAAPHPSAAARAAFRRSGAGLHGTAHPARARRRANRQQEHEALRGNWD